MTQRLNCRNFEDHIHHVMDCRQPVMLDLALNEHASKCHRCQSILDAYATVDNALESFDPSLLASVQPKSEAADTLIHDRFGILGLMASIAAVMLVVLYWNTGEQLAPTSLTQVIPSEATPVAPQTPGPVVIESDSATAPVQPMQLAGEMDNAQTVDARLGENERKQTGIVSFHMQEPRIRVVSWDRITSSLNPITPYTRYSSEIPGVRPLQSGLNVTLDLIQQSLQTQTPDSTGDPDLGHIARPHFSVT